MATPLSSGSLTSATTTTPVQIFGRANLSLTGTFVGTVALERADSSTGTFTVVSRDVAGTPATFTTAFQGWPFEEDEQGMWYRLNCTSYTSGTINWRFGVGSVLVPGQQAPRP